jgi:Ca2+-transporting ATPase
MKKPPRDTKASLLSDGMGWHILRVGVLVGVVALAIGFITYRQDSDSRTWQTMIFTTLAFLQIGQALASRSSTTSFFRLGFFTNPTLLLMVVITFALQLIAIYVPFLDEFFQVTPLSITELLICMGLGSLAFVAIEAEKLILRRNGN